MNVYAVRDEKAEEFGPPTVSKNDAVAARKYQQLVDSMPDSVKADFVLYRLGVWNPDSGIIDSIVPIVRLTGFDAVLGKFEDLTEVL